ncbi:hypothetical protein [Polaribacter sp. L3A8]|uniref:hypothetical protein n=1 Tax=Polaribacter sp. L3A8 TaxID=2686361 RepID=UPI00131EC692|nr:hypothetical protein [Polaribacter sp. L3A8]
MKKIFYLFAITAFVFTSCNPLEDVIEDVDALTANDALVDDLVFTLSDDDYTADVEDGGFGFSFPNFSNQEQALELLPGFLSAKYPQLGVTYSPNGDIKKKSTALVSYKLFNKKNDEKSLITYTVEAGDYTAAGLRFSNISNDDQAQQLLNYLYPTPEERVLVALTYDAYDSGITTTVENGFIYVNDTWEKSNGITLAEYNAMGEVRAQFSNEDEALSKIPLYLKGKEVVLLPKKGDIEGVMYKLFDSSARVVNSFVAFFIYDGANWSTYNNVIDQSIQLGHDGQQWVPDNTIKRTLSAADVAFISSEFLSKYPGPADNLGFFKSFDVRSSSGNYWNNDMLLEAFNALLNDIDPSAEEKQKYSLTYVVFDGSTVNNTINLIKDGADYRLKTADDD